MARNPILTPINDRLVDDDDIVTLPWSKYFAALAAGSALAANTIASVEKLTQAASIATTSIPIQTVYAAMYRVSYYARITQAATTSSSLTITLGWTESSVSQTASGSAMTGNTTTTQQNSILTVKVDGSSPITYATTYSSTGATAMQYRLNIAVELIG